MKCPHCGKYILSKRQNEILALIGDSDGISKWQLKKIVNRPYPRIHEMVKVLEEAGLVCRKPIMGKKGSTVYLYTTTENES